MSPRFHGKGFPSIHEHEEGYYDHPGWYDDDEPCWKLAKHHNLSTPWEQVTFHNDIGFEAYWAKFDAAAQWIQDNVKDWEVNCRWNRVNDCSYFYFLDHKDAMQFKLTWG